MHDAARSRRIRSPDLALRRTRKVGGAYPSHAAGAVARLGRPPHRPPRGRRPVPPPNHRCRLRPDGCSPCWSSWILFGLAPRWALTVTTLCTQEVGPMVALVPGEGDF